MRRLAVVIAAALIASSVAHADEMPVPKVYEGVPMQRGSWRMELLEMSGPPGAQAAKGTTVNLCLDSVVEMSKQRKKSAPDAGCNHELIRDTPSEAIMESRCGESLTRSRIAREGSQSFLIKVDESGPQGESSMQARYSYQGPCKAGAGMISTDKNSPQCQQARAQVAGMDPAKLCANAGAQKQRCEASLAEAQAQVESMCQ